MGGTSENLGKTMGNLGTRSALSWGNYTKGTFLFVYFFSLESLEVGDDGAREDGGEGKGYLVADDALGGEFRIEVRLFGPKGP